MSTIRFMDIKAEPLQTGADPLWQEGRVVDMEAFDQLPLAIRNFLNEQISLYPVEDVLYEHQFAHGGDEELTLVWLLEGQDFLFNHEANRRPMV